MGRSVKGSLPPDVYEEFEEYRSERDLKKSEAVKRLVQAGLDARTRGDNVLLALASAMLIGGVVTLALSIAVTGSYLPHAAAFGVASALFSVAYVGRGVAGQRSRERFAEVLRP